METSGHSSWQIFRRHSDDPESGVHLVQAGFWDHTPSLADAFGYSSGSHGASRFPIARMTFIELAGLNVIWNYRLDDYRCSEESHVPTEYSVRIDIKALTILSCGGIPS